MTTRISTNNIQPSALAALDGPAVTNIQITNSSYVVLDDTAVSLTGGFIRITGTNFSSGCSVIIGTVSATSVTFISSTTLNVQVPAAVAGTYVVYVINSDGGVAIRVNGLTYSSEPSWVTGSSLLGDSGVAVSIQLSAIGASTYSLQAGSTLPANLTLSSSGLISGIVTVVNDTLYNFTVIATDAELQDSPRSFSITITVGDVQFMYVTTLLNPALSVLPFNDDASINHFPISVFGDTRPNNFDPYAHGYYSNFFDGAGDYLTLPATGIFDFGTGDFTVEAWIYPTASGSWMQIAGSAYSATGGALYVSPTLGLAYYTNGQGTPTANNSIRLNVWQHVAAVRTSGTVQLYIDGIQGSSAAMTNNFTTLGGTIASRTSPLNSELFTGFISNVRAVRSAIYTGTTFTPPTAPLTAIANTSLLTCQSNRFIDNSTNNFAITRVGDARIDGFDPFVIPNNIGVPNLYSAYFDGTGDRLTTSASAAQFGTGDFTIEFWINLSSLAATVAIIDFRSTASATFGQIYIATDRTVHFYLPVDIATTNTITLGAWNHVAISRSSGTLIMFINGAAGYSSASGGTFNAAGSVTVGSSVDGTAAMTGCLSNLRIVAGTGLYAGNFTPPTQPLTAVSGTSLLTCQNSSFVDNSTNNFAITSVGQAQPIAVTPFTQTFTSQSIVGSGSTYFDGNGDVLTVPNNAALAFGTGDFTLEMWYYTTVTPTSTNVCLYNTGSSNFFIQLRNSAFGIGVVGSAENNAFTATFAANQWYHIAVSRSGSTVRGFVNGSLVGSGSNSVNYGQSGATIGGLTSSSQLITGYISNLRVVKGTAVYTNSFTPPAAPLTAITNTSLLTCQTAQPSNNSQFLDSSSNSFVLSRLGNTTQGSFSPYGGSWSNYFDGTGDFLTLPTNAALGPTTGDYTWEAWLYPTVLGSNKVIYVSSQSSGGLVIGIGNSTANRLTVFRNGVAFDFIGTTDMSVYLNRWVHVAVTKQSGTTRFWIDGVNTDTFTTNHTYVAGGTAASIGRRVSVSEDYTGSISNMRLVNGTAVYTTNFTPPTQPLTAIANTSLLTCADNRFVDDSANNFAITRNGDVRVDKFSPFGIVTAATPQTHSAFFDGSGDSIQVGSSNTGVTFGTADFTIEAWIYWNSLSSESAIMFGNGIGWTFYVFPANKLQWGRTSPQTPANLLTGNTTLNTGTWYHIAVTRASGTVTLWVNGVSDGTVADSANYSASGDLRVGISHGGLFFNGYMSNVRVVKGTAVYTANFTPPTTPLTAITNTSLLTCQSPTFVDNSTNRFAITAVGDARPTQINPFGFTTGTRTNYTPQVFGGSMSFDGTGDYLSSTSNAAIGTGPFTIECWIYPTALGTQRSIVVNSYWNIGDNGGYRLHVTSSNTIQLQASTGTYNTFPTVITSSTALPSANQWYHIAVVRNSSNSIMIYINGVAAATAVTYASSLNLGGGQTLKIGGVISDGGLFEPFLGYISNVRVLSGTAVYPSSFVPPVAPVEHVPNTVVLLNGTSAAVCDVSTLNNLETVGDARSEQFGPYNAGFYSNFFDGTGDYIALTPNSSLTLDGDYTIEFWIYFTSLDTAERIPANCWNTGAGWLFSTQTNAWNFKSAGSLTLTYSAVAPAASQWYHVAATRSGSATNNVKFFINGVQVAQGTNTSTLTPAASSTGCVIGGGQGGTGQLITGYVSNFRIVKGTAVYTAAFTPPVAPLTAISNTSILTCQSNRFIDNSTNNFAITRNGDTRVQTQNPFQNNSGQSYYFDGTGDYLVTYSPAVNQSIAFGTGSFTVEFWFNASSNAGSQQLFDTRPTGQSSTSQYIALTYLSGSLNYYTATANPAISGGAVTAGVWNHVALSRSGTSTRLFVNGVQVGSTYADSQNYLGSINRPIIATDGNSPNTANFTGFISDLRITRGIARYIANFTPPSTAFQTK